MGSECPACIPHHPTCKLLLNIQIFIPLESCLQCCAVRVVLIQVVDLFSIQRRGKEKVSTMHLANLLLVVQLLIVPAAFARRLPRNCGLACNSVKKCMAVLDGSGGNRPGQLGNTGIIVLETCAPKLAKARKKGCTCDEVLDKANDAEEADDFHAATQKSVRTSGFRNRGEATSTSTESPQDIRRPSRFSSSRSNSGSVRSGTERATASISRPALRGFRSSRPDSTSSFNPSSESTSASFSVSSSVSTSTSSQRTPRRSLFGTTDRRKFFGRRRL